MTAMQRVLLKCSTCGARFPPPFEVSSTETLRAMIEYGGIVECRDCHRFVFIGPLTLGHTLADGSWRSV